MILSSVEDLQKKKGPFALTMGNFDGLHIGHKRIISTLIDEARKDGLTSLVVTFTNHPKELITGEKVIPVISSDEKLERLEEEGVDLVLGLEFTQEIRQMSQKEFLDYLGVEFKKIIVGHDFKFGHDGSKYNSDEIETIPVEALVVDGKIVSSTIIREYMSQGEMEKLRLFLGRPYRHSGKVIHGKKVGKALGYPTTNVTINESVYALRTGVYVTKTYLVDSVFKSVTNIGRIPTFDGRPFSVETHILDFDRSIYGEEVRIEFLHYLRKEEKFDDVDALKARIAEDVEATRDYFNNHPEEV